MPCILLELQKSCELCNSVGGMWAEASSGSEADLSSAYFTITFDHYEFRFKPRDHSLGQYPISIAYNFEHLYRTFQWTLLSSLVLF